MEFAQVFLHSQESLLHLESGSLHYQGMHLFIIRLRIRVFIRQFIHVFCSKKVVLDAFIKENEPIELFWTQKNLNDFIYIILEGYSSCLLNGSLCQKDVSS